jgi:integrase
MEVQQEKPRLKYGQQWPEKQIGTVAWVLERYWKEMSEGERPMGTSMVYRLKALQRMPIGARVAKALEQEDFIEFCRWRKQQKWRGKAITAVTVGHDLAMLSVAFKYAGAAWKECKGLSAIAIDAARPFLMKNGLISKSQPRDRRPSQDELDRLIAYFTERNGRRNTKVDMALMTRWQVASGRRISESCRLTYGDWDETNQIMMVRKMKDPRRKKDKLVALTDEAIAILQEQKAKRLRPDDPTERIFPFNHRSVIAAYVEAKKVLGISGLRLHDNRRECGSRIIDQGGTSDDAILVTGHETKQVFDRVYNKPKPELFRARLAAKRFEVAA